MKELDKTYLVHAGDKGFVRRSDVEVRAAGEGLSFWLNGQPANVHAISEASHEFWAALENIAARMKNESASRAAGLYE